MFHEPLGQDTSFLLQSPWPSLVLLFLLLLFLLLHLLLLAFFLVFLATFVSHACSLAAIMPRGGERAVDVCQTRHLARPALSQ